MNLSETCSCGATFEVDADSGEALGAVMSWRATHRHEVTVEDDVEVDDA